MGIKYDRDYYDDKSLTTDEPLRFARIGYRSVVTETNITASSETAGFPADAMGTPNTYEFWKPVTLPATVTIDAGAQVAVDYFGLAVANLKDCEIRFSTSVDGTTYTERRAAVMVNNRAAMFLFDTVTARYFRFEVIGWAETSTLSLDFAANEYSVGDYTDTGGLFLGVVYVGKVLQMQRGIYQGHTPVTLAEQNEIRPTQSEGGQWLGRSVVRKGYQNRFAWQHLKALWYRDNFDPFVKAAVTAPFFIAWRPETYADEVVYGWTQGDITPDNTGPADFMGVEMTVTGHGEE